MNKKSIAVVLFFSIFVSSLVSCEDEKKSDSDNNDLVIQTSLSIQSTDPADNGNISQGDTITAQLNYSIANFDSTKQYFATIWFERDDTQYQRETSCTFVVNSSTGTLELQYVLGDEATKLDYKNPLEVLFALYVCDDIASVDWENDCIAITEEFVLNVL